MHAWQRWMSCVTSSGCRPDSQIIGSLITLNTHLCNCMWKFLEAFIHDHFVKCWASAMISSTGSYSWQFFKLCTAYATCWILCMRCAHILFFMFSGPGQHCGYSDYLSASLGLWNLPPTPEVIESVELYLYSPCRPWMPWNVFFTF